MPRDGERAAMLEAALNQNAGSIAAIIVEPLIQGAGGMRFHETETLATIARIARPMECC